MKKAAKKMQDKELEQVRIRAGINELIDRMMKELSPQKPPDEVK